MLSICFEEGVNYDQVKNRDSLYRNTRNTYVTLISNNIK